MEPKLLRTGQVGAGRLRRRVRGKSTNAVITYMRVATQRSDASLWSVKIGGDATHSATHSGLQGSLVTVGGRVKVRTRIASAAVSDNSPSSTPFKTPQTPPLRDTPFTPRR